MKRRQRDGNLFIFSIAWSQGATLQQGCSSEPTQGLWRSENKDNLRPQRWPQPESFHSARHIPLMMKVTLEATSVLMKNAWRRDRKKQKEWPDRFTGLLFTNAKAHLGLINYGGDRRCRGGSASPRRKAERRDGNQPDDAVRAAPQEMLSRKTLSTTRGDLILKPLRESRMPHPWILTTQPSFEEGILCGRGGFPHCPTDAYLQWTEMGPSCPNCSFVLCTWPMKSMNPSPDLGTPCSGQSVNWNCRTVLDWPSCRKHGWMRITLDRKREGDHMTPPLLITARTSCLLFSSAGVFVCRGVCVCGCVLRRVAPSWS